MRLVRRVRTDTYGDGFVTKSRPGYLNTANGLVEMLGQSGAKT